MNNSQQVDLTHLTTFRTSAMARHLVELSDVAQLKTISQQLKDNNSLENFIVIGGGSNILFANDYNGTIILNRLKGKHIVSEDEERVSIRCGAGEIWHDIVCEMSEKGFYGLENLALIPGTIGAAPVQNIGAYGVEVANFMTSVEAFDICDNAIKTFTADECEFAYRDSVFKREENRYRYIITSVTLTLSKVFNPVLTYKGLYEGLTKSKLTASDLLQRVIEVRQSKLPNPDDVPNAGSFFKNPIVSKELFNQLQEEYENIPSFMVDERTVKIPAAWLLQTAGFKGLCRDNGAGVYEKHALILVNRGNAHGRDIYQLACDMIEKVQQQFGITIEPEVRIIGIS